ncbi:MAG TPA: hypothetical protein EYP24_02385, partial [bacterium (Candidatus Stahlbacteria)]|nr:hypothetical protein [Candidatus Stahlbacteria bacterium]
MPQRSVNPLLFVSLRPLTVALLILLSYPLLYDVPRPFVIIFLVSILIIPIFLLLNRIFTARLFYYSL